MTPPQVVLLLFGSVLFLGAAATTIYLARVLPSPSPSLRGRFSVDQLGLIESSLPALVRVIVVAHRIERPPGKLQEAVEGNFLNNVPYLFLVSGESAKEERKQGYYRIFEALADIVRARSSTTLQIQGKLVDIMGLPYTWDDYPYIFYQMRDQGGIRTIALRGDQKLEGVAESYDVVDPRSAQTIAQTVVRGAPHPIPLESEQFEDSQSKVVSILDHLSQSRSEEAKAN